jgi:hypothetical protein
VRRALTWVLALTALAGPQALKAQPQSEWQPTLVEVLQLPKYCQGWFRKELDFPGNPIATCGDWFNHFCPGLVALNRAAQPTRSMTERRYFLQNGTGHLGYTRKHLSPTCALAEDLRAAEARARILAITVK